MTFATRLPLGWRLAMVASAIMAGTVAAIIVGVGLAAERILIESTADRLEIGAGLLVDRPRAGPPVTALDASDVVRLLGGQETAVTIIGANGDTLATADNGADPAIAAVRLGASSYATARESGVTIREVMRTSAGLALVVAAPIELTRGRRGGAVSAPSDPGTGPGRGQGRGGGAGPPFVPPGQVGRATPAPDTGAEATPTDEPDGAARGRANAIAQLAVSLAPVEATVATIRAQIAVIGIVALLVGLLAIVLVTRRSLQPLGQVAAAASRLAEGDLAARTHLSGSDEIGAVGGAFDAMADRLETAVRAQRAFAADASHELRTPIAVLGGYVDLLERGDLPEADQRRLLESMRREVDRVERLASDLLLLTRIEGGGPVMEPAPMDLAEVAREIANAGATLDPRTPIRFRADVALPVMADPGRIAQALLNLVANASRHATAGSTVDIVARRDGPNALVDVANDGIPMDPAELDHVFERFVSGSAGHTGLGLPIARAIVEANGGDIRAASDRSRTMFTIRLPLAGSQHVLSERTVEPR